MGQADDGSPDAFVADQEVRPAPQEAHGHVALPRGAERSGELAGRAGLDEEVGGTADFHGGEGREGLGEADGDQAFLKERVEAMDGDHRCSSPLSSGRSAPDRQNHNI